MSWFGPSRDDVWRELSQEMRAEFIEACFWKGRECKVRARIGPWTVTLETGFSSDEDHGVTRIRAPFFNPEGFRFTVCRRVLLNKLGKLLGTLQDINVGDAEFDKFFIVLGNSEAKVRAFLGDPGIRRMMPTQTKTRLLILPIGGWFQPRYPVGVDELQLQVVGKIRDIDQLREMFELFVAVLDRLCVIGTTCRQAPSAVA
jgi:hypothetical protein